MAVATPKLRSSSPAAPPPSRTAPPAPKKRPRDRPKAGGRPRKVDLNSPAPSRTKTKAAPKRKASPGVRAAAAKAAPARKAPARRKVAPKRRTPAGVIPIAAGHAGRAAVAVTQLPESGLIHRLTRGRLWIGLLGLLLVGIVALNVVTLSFAASSGKIDAKNTELGKENSMLQGLGAAAYGNARMRHEAVELGLGMPTDQVPRMISTKGSDVAEAASRLAAAGAAVAGTAEEGAASEGSTGEEVASGETGSVEGAVPGAESTEDLSQFTPEQIEGFEQEYAELLAAEGVTELPAE